jgi:hypothetical protein
VRN